MVVFIGLFIFLALVYYAFITTKRERLETHFFPALGIKLIAGLGVGLLYFYYYRSGDTLRFDTAASLTSGSIHTAKDWFLFLFRSDLSFLSEKALLFPEEPRSLFFVKILSLLYLISGGSYWVASLYLSFFSFYGAWILSVVITHYWPDLRYPAILSFLYFPTVVFWSSGVLKDAVAYGCITFLAAQVIKGLKGEGIGIKGYLAGFGMIWVLWSVKYHLAVILMLSIGVGVLHYPIYRRFKGVLGNILLIVTLIFVAVALSFLHLNFRLGNLMEVISQNHATIIRISEETNLVHFLPYGTGFIHFMLNIPISFFAGLFMPLPWQGTGLLPNLAGIINAIILLLTFVKLFSWRGDRIHCNVWCWMMGIYIGLLAVMMAYTTPNFGTLERYKIAYIPFYLLWLLDNKKLLNIAKSLFIHKFW